MFGPNTIEVGLFARAGQGEAKPRGFPLEAHSLGRTLQICVGLTTQAFPRFFYDVPAQATPLIIEPPNKPDKRVGESLSVFHLRVFLPMAWGL